MKSANQKVTSLFDLNGRISIITGAAGFLGMQHCEILAAAGATVIALDINAVALSKLQDEMLAEHNVKIHGFEVDITKERDILKIYTAVVEQFGTPHILVNNAANNPGVDSLNESNRNRFESFELAEWGNDIEVALTGSFLCCKTFGPEMAKAGRGSIVNICSDLALIGPDQRLYEMPGVAEDEQPTKPVTYSVAKTGLLGLTRYLATYWASKGVRVNALSPGGVYNNQPKTFLDKVEKLIPMGRMATADDYQGALLFLCSDASSYMTGANLVVDGGRTCW